MCHFLPNDHLIMDAQRLAIRASMTARDGLGAERGRGESDGQAEVVCGFTGAQTASDGCLSSKGA